MPGRPSVERRKGQRRAAADRRHTTVRTGRDRRVGARKGSGDRRRADRRSRKDRRVLAGRRFTDRQRSTPAPYSSAQLMPIREILSHLGTQAACPECGGMLNVGPLTSRFGTAVREVRCQACFRAVVLTIREPIRVLLIDYDQVARNVLRELLAMAGHEVMEAADGDQGLKAYRERPADVVLISLSGPRDPIEWIRRFSRDFPRAQIVAMAGPRRFGAPDPLATASSIGTVRVLRKPFGAADLLKVVEEARGARSRASNPLH